MLDDVKHVRRVQTGFHRLWKDFKLQCLWNKEPKTQEEIDNRARMLNWLYTCKINYKEISNV